MAKKGHLTTILIAEDDPDDRLLIQKAFDEGGLKNPVAFVEDGEEVMDFLYGRGSYSEAGPVVKPDLILLDLNMPCKSGLEVLQELKSDPSLRGIPVIILTTSKAREDMLNCYALGACSYITKPVTFELMVEMLVRFRKYWMEVVDLP